MSSIPVGNVLNSIGRVSITVNLVVLGVMLLMTVAFVVMAVVDIARPRQPGDPARQSSWLQVVMFVTSALGLFAVMWLLYTSLTSKSSLARRVRQASGVSLLL